MTNKPLAKSLPAPRPGAPLKSLLSIPLLFFATNLFAHSVWIEVERGVARVNYGEPEVALVESSPGKLDTIELTEGFVPGQPDGLTPRPGPKGVLLGNVRTGDTVLARAQAKAPYMADDGKKPTRSLYYARRMAWPLQGAAAAALDLDIVPVPGERNTFRVYFKGEPLRAGTLKAMAPSLWVQIHDIDEQGRVRIQTPWRGRYVLDVEHEEAAPGEQAGQRYIATAHRASLSFVQPTGVVFAKPLPPQFKVH